MNGIVNGIKSNNTKDMTQYNRNCCIDYVFPGSSAHLVHCFSISMVCVYTNVIACSRSALQNQISCHFQLPHFFSGLRVAWEHTSSISLYRPRWRAECHTLTWCAQPLTGNQPAGPEESHSQFMWQSCWDLGTSSFPLQNLLHWTAC